MKIKELSADVVGLPVFPIEDKDITGDLGDVSYFELSSHARAREAMAFAIKMRPVGANAFVVGGDRSGRMTATLEYIRNHIKQLPALPDWVYLNNFVSSHRPIPFRLPTGYGRKLKEDLAEIIDSIHELLNKTFSGPSFTSQVNAMTASLESEVHEKIETLQVFANSKGLKIDTGPDEFTILALDNGEGEGQIAKPYSPQDVQEIRDRLGQITAQAHIQGRDLSRQVDEVKRQEAEKILQPLMAKFIEEYTPYLGDWIDEFIQDIFAHIDDFIDDEGQGILLEELADRYAVNLLVDNRNNHHPQVIIDPSPTYESLFGSIKYKSTASGYATDFTMIRAGNLHRANGGILVLRAEVVANNYELWNALKVALRDKAIRIEERHRENAMPILDAPDPKSVPLDIQIFLVGAPAWYYNFFFNDPEFKNYFKIKADIEPDMPATAENISVYTQLIRQFARENSKKFISKEAVQFLLGYSARWINHRHRLSAKFELIIDLINEANIHAQHDRSEIITAKHTNMALISRRFRNSVLEDRSHRDLECNVILIDTTGEAVGQVNGLSVLTTGDHHYGIPNRITARTYAGEEGVINIERLTDMSGPIQQKAALILDGYINGKFALKHPVSCACSLTFEQNYGEIEGDSASLAELLAVISSLSQLPLRQDIAITGSINQFGHVQAVGGINHKIEGFFRLCDYRGLTGTQGVIIPLSNLDNLTLRDNVRDAIAAGKFKVWPVSTVEQAIELMTGIVAGVRDEKGDYPKKSVFGAVDRSLKEFQKALSGTKVA